MGLLTDTFRFSADGHDWQVEIHTPGERFRYRVWCDGELVHEQFRHTGGDVEEMYRPFTLAVSAPEGPLDITIGQISHLSAGCVVSRNGEVIHRSHDKAFIQPDTSKGFLGWLNKLPSDDDEPDAEEMAKQERAKARMPAIGVDLSMGVLFFFVAREFGLPTAALTGAGVTIGLFILQRLFLTKTDLLGGFAVFGVVMALISASLALAFDNDLFIKLRGTIVGLIGAGFALADGLFNRGNYLGARIAGYMESLMTLAPQRAAFGLAFAGSAMAMIDLPLAFILTTDQWIWYNAFLDSFIAMPIVLGTLWYLRER
jgi:intracellular septation protein A